MEEKQEFISLTANNPSVHKALSDGVKPEENGLVFHGLITNVTSGQFTVWSSRDLKGRFLCVDGVSRVILNPYQETKYSIIFDERFDVNTVMQKIMDVSREAHEEYKKSGESNETEQ